MSLDNKRSLNYNIYIYCPLFFVSRNESVCDLTKSKGESFTEFPAESLIDQERVRISVT
jgi:hypothetical protein